MPQGSILASAALANIAALACYPVQAVEAGIAAYSAVSDSIPQPLDGLTGNSEQGRRLVLDRETGNCLICHQVPVPREPSQGDLGPSLVGVGSRLDAGQLRYRLVDQSMLNPATIMPPYYRIDRLTRVAGKYQFKPVFSSQEIEDVVAWLATLREQGSGR